MFRVIVTETVSRALGQWLTRASMLAVFNRLHDQLTHHADRFRGRRNRTRPDDYFDYYVNLADENDEWHTLRFTVDDRQAAGYLFVMGVGYRPGKVRPR